MRRLLGTAVAIGLVLGIAGCSDDSGDGGVSSSTPGATTVATASATTDSEQNYVVFPDGPPAEGWVISTAARTEDPETMDFLDEVDGIHWSTEYEQMGDADEDEDYPYLKVSGIDRPLGAVQYSETITWTDGEIGGRPARWGVDSEDPEGSTYVLFALSDRTTITLESFLVTLDDLRGFAADLEPASADDWISVNQSAGAA